MKKGTFSKNIFVYIAVAVLALAGLYVLSKPNATQEIPVSQVSKMATGKVISEITVEGDRLTIINTNGDKFTSRKENGTSIQEILGSRADDIEINVKGSSGVGSALGLAINFLPLLIFGGLLFFMMRQAQGNSNQAMNFGKSKAKLLTDNRPTITFSDVAGVPEAKIELGEVVDFLKQPEKFTALGARIPSGVLLVGPPGTGKTLLARAIAGEAVVPFFSISGSDFVEMFVGVGASRVRDLFDQAKRNSPCIIFIDEIDAVGRHRGAGLGGGHDEREQTLNQILVEMDGFNVTTNVIVIAATNRPDILDPALLRPGRFDRRVTLDAPDLVGRKEILKVHFKGKPVEDRLDIEVVAKQTAGFSGADLANLCNESAILAARADKKSITMPEIAEAIDRVIAGPEKKSRIISDEERKVTAYHEAGHALTAWMLPNSDKVHKISIIARGGMGGYTRLLPKDRYLWSMAQFKDVLATSLGGRLAEEIVFNQITTGASNDLENATKVSREMITRYGMSKKLGPRTFGKREEMVFLGREISDQRDYSDKVAELIDDEVKDLIESAHKTAKAIITKNRQRLDVVAKYLIKHESVEGEELEHLFKSKLPSKTAKKRKAINIIKSGSSPKPAAAT